MVAQVPFHRWGGEGVPLPVRQQLFDIGSGATSCVVCSQPGHGIHTCPNTQSAEGQALAAAWDKKWLLLLGQELIRYAMCPDDAEYRRLSAALQLKLPVDRAAVLAFQRQNAIQSTSPGYGVVFGRQLAKPANTSQSAQVPQPSAVLKSKPKPAPKQAPKPAPKQAPKAPAKISIVATPAVPQPVKHERKHRNRRQRKAQQAASTQVYGLQTSEMEVDAAPPSLVPAAPSPPRSAIRTSASPKIQALRTSRSTAITPPPPLPSSNEQTVQVSSPLQRSPTSSPPRAAGQLPPPPAPLLPSPGTAFRSIAVGCSSNSSSSSSSTEVSHLEDRQSRSTAPSEGKNTRSISASALVPTSKSVRSGDDVCIPAAAQRGQVSVGSMSTAIVVHSQPVAVVPSQSSQRPYQLWSLDRYLAATSSSRKLFWQRAAEDKRWEIAAALSNMPERTEAVQEAWQDFGAERWGLKPGGGGGGGNDAAEPADEDEQYL